MRLKIDVQRILFVVCPAHSVLNWTHPFENAKLIQIRQARSYNNCCGGKTISITYFDCVFVALVIRHATRMRHNFTRGLPRSKIFFHISHKRYVFRKEVIEHEMCILIFSTPFIRNISHSSKK